jgi:Putative polyhydroxyalkanoic acid system protein (PHA_gran_rgn)
MEPANKSRKNMASLKLNIPHQLSEQEALTRIKDLFSQLKVEQKDRLKNVEEEWDKNTGTFKFNAQGFDLAGKIHVDNKTVQIDGKLPLALSFFKGKISEIITKKATDLLSR